jgi:EpsI family protein
VNGPSQTTLPLVGTLLLLSVTLAMSKVTSNRLPLPLSEPLESIGLQLAGFTGVRNPALQENVLRELKPTSYITRTYRKADLPADVFIAFYAQQRAGESMHSPKHCLPGSGWEIWDYSTMEVSAQGRTYTVNKYSISRETRRSLVLYWYQSPGRIFASEYMGKLLLARDALFRNSTSGSIVRIIVPDAPGTLQQSTALASALMPEVARCFGDR